MRLLTLILFLPLIHVLPAHSASFDCNKAVTDVERMICSNAELSNLDEELMTVYVQALVVAREPVIIKNKQRVWLRNIRNKSINVHTLKKEYTVRINELRRLLIINNYDAVRLDVKLIGDWIPYSRAFIETGKIYIDSASIKHQNCNYRFKLKSKKNDVLLFEAENNGICHATLFDEFDTISVVQVNSDEIIVKYYDISGGKGLLGEGTYTKIIK
jgi:uncharacterized protein